MINKPTVFVLGAGASHPFGFPTGARLRELICSMPTAQESPTRELLRKAFGYYESAWTNFALEFTKSGLASIDAFLGRRTDFENIGRDTIACCISSFENEDSLFSVGGIQGFSDWYGALWNRMMENIQTPNELIANKVSFVTFNYDRSLEAYLHNAIKATFSCDDSTAEAIWTQIPIHHVYGSLGQFKPSKGLGYGLSGDGECLENQLLNGAASIIVMPTTRGVDKDCIAVDLISKADVIAFMGFGFDEINCKRLDLPEALKRRAFRTSNLASIYGTKFGMTGGEANAADQRLFNYLPPQANVNFDRDFNCFRSFRDWGSWIG